MKKPLYTVVLRITRNVQLSEDVLQELFVKIYFSPPTNVTSPRAYIYRMAHNLAVDTIRKQREYVELNESDITLQCNQNNTLYESGVEKAIMTLPERERTIVTMRLNGDLKFREIAQILTIPLGTVLWSYRKAIGKLQTILGDTI
ncbi:MAG: RNA polymerase sigma factor [Dehalococcoidia bacterium]|nr:RNA polymerase sigma factor [Dehalococcoidia bacterium]